MTVHDGPLGRIAGRPRIRSASDGVLPLVLLADLAAGLVLAWFVVTSPVVDRGPVVLVMAVWILAMFFLGGFAPGINISSALRSLAQAWALSAATVSFLGFFPSGLEPLKLAFVVVTAISAVDGIARLLIAQTHVERILMLMPSGFTDVPEHTGKAQVTLLQLSPNATSDSSELLRLVFRAVVDSHSRVVEIPVNAGIPAEVISNLSWKLRERNIQIRMVLAHPNVSAARVRTAVVQGRTILEIAAPRPAAAVQWGKRAVDVIGSGTLILLLSPVMLVLATIVRATTNASVFYRQERIGLDGHPFHILKFRSMVADADAALAALLLEQGRADSPLFKVQDDPRITPIGKVMRKYSLDELPQLFNVFSGTMSLVGPRPQRAAEVALYKDDHLQRLGVLPGMTGMWQVSGRSRLTWEQAIELDIYYAHNWNLGTDLMILLRTFKAVIRGDGAE